MRDLSLLKLHLGADPATLATHQLHAPNANSPNMNSGGPTTPAHHHAAPWLTLDAGIANE